MLKEFIGGCDTLKQAVVVDHEEVQGVKAQNEMVGETTDEELLLMAPFVENLTETFVSCVNKGNDIIG